MKSVIGRAAELVNPTDKEETALQKKVEETIIKIDKAARVSRVKAKLIVGGSVGKGSWLPGIHDLDFFLLFNFQKYKDKSEEISDIAERVLKKIFPKIARVHGSRDYFQLKQGKLLIEIIPVIEIKKVEDARNITDASPLHVSWVKKHLDKNDRLVTDLRLAKKFFKAQQAYGAESFIQGFSGHVIEILTCHYGSFEKLVKAAKGWEKGLVIDVEKHYKNSKEALEKLNPEKKKSSIIVIDPIEANRNAAASLRGDVFNRLVNGCTEFVEKPTIEFFTEKKVELKDLKKLEKKTKKLVAVEASIKRYRGQKMDIIGAKLKKQYEQILRLFEENDFIILESNLYWDHKGPAIFYYFLDPKELSKIKTLRGPLTYGPQENIVDFKSKYKRKKIYRQGYNYFVEVPRKVRKIPNILKVLKEDKAFSNIKVLK